MVCLWLLGVWGVRGVGMGLLGIGYTLQWKGLGVTEVRLVVTGGRVRITEGWGFRG